MSFGLWILVGTAGAFGGLVDAVAGMGFGALSSTAMLAGGITPAVVIATVSLAKIGSGLFSGMAHWGFGNVNWRWAVPLILSGILGAIGGATLLTNLPDDAVRIGMPCLLILLGVPILQRFLLAPPTVRRPIAGGSQTLEALLEEARPALGVPLLKRLLSRFQIHIIGFWAGVVNALSGTYGPFATSALLATRDTHPRYVVGTANFAEIFVAAATTVTLFAHMGAGEFRWGLSIALMIGGAITAPVGAYLTRRLPARTLGIIVGVAVISINIYSLAKALA
ncbi:MAG: sulfite exporter TauE/SafE family protein [Dehalococcoidia bacterium]|nr:sulfite exporter TauE/SafE family protein [Dehalococcoidia bacterium]